MFAEEAPQNRQGRATCRLEAIASAAGRLFLSCPESSTSMTAPAKICPDPEVSVDQFDFHAIPSLW